MTTEGNTPPVQSEAPKVGKLKTPIGILMALLIGLVPGAIVAGAIYAIKSGAFNSKRDQVLVFEGAIGGGSTPEFQVQHDWIVDIEWTGNCRNVILTKRDNGDNTSEQEGYFDSELLDSKQPTSRITKSISIGGTYVIRFDGTGKWKATIRQETYGP